MSTTLLDYTMQAEEVAELEGIPELVKRSEEARDRARPIAVAGEIVTPEGAERVTEILGELVGIRKDLEERRQELVRPFIDSKANVDGAFKEMRGPVEAAEKALKGLVAGYHERERERAEAEAKRIREEAEAEARRQAEEHARLERERQERAAAEEAVPEPPAPPPEPPPAPEPPPPPPSSTRSGKATASVRRPWRHRIVDPDQVPREYLVVDEAKIRAAVRAGERSIAGVEIYQDDEVAVR